MNISMPDMDGTIKSEWRHTNKAEVEVCSHTPSAKNLYRVFIPHDHVVLLTALHI